jgi:hypothetical protein
LLRAGDRRTVKSSQVANQQKFVLDCAKSSSEVINLFFYGCGVALIPFHSLFVSFAHLEFPSKFFVRRTTRDQEQVQVKLQIPITTFALCKKREVFFRCYGLA